MKHFTMKRMKILEKKKIKLNNFMLLVLTNLLLGFTILVPETYGQESITITGNVRSQADNEPLPGVTVVIQGTTRGATTDLDGFYSIEASPGDVIKLSFVGYHAESFTVEADQTHYETTLSEDVIGLSEVVVTGYGVQQKSLVTGSIASVDGENIGKVRAPNATQALQGLAAGVHVIPRTGRPGEASDIRIRGISSISGTDPLIVIDGIPGGNLDNLNTNDIQSIEVLKDASSAAIYGASGGNGVILVTTRSGEKGELQTSFDFYHGFTQPVGKVDLMNSQQWADLMYEQDILTTTNPDTLPNYDWQDLIFDNAITEDYNLSISGGNERSTFLLNANYNKQEGIVKATQHERSNVRIQSNHELTSWLTLDQRTRFVNTVGEGIPAWEWQEYYANPIAAAMRMPPVAPAYEEDGS